MTSLINLAVLYKAMGGYAKAEPLLKEALETRQKVLGPEHPDTVRSLNSLAEIYQAMGEYAKAEPLLQEALRIRQKFLGPEDPDAVASVDNLAVLYRAMGDVCQSRTALPGSAPDPAKVPGARTSRNGDQPP